jgi:hypothetical protein
MTNGKALRDYWNIVNLLFLLLDSLTRTKQNIDAI